MIYAAAMPYPPPYYTDDDPAYARRIITENGFALLNVGLEATHLPLLFEDVDGQGRLLGHLSRQNPMALMLDRAAQPALAVFSGPHAYISASLYEAPHRSVPTWNYASVHVRGALSRLPDEALASHLEALARAYETPGGWSVSDAPDYVAAIQSGIIAVSLNIETMQAYRKMSANKPEPVQNRIIEDARVRGDHAFAREMTLSLETGKG